MVFIEVEDKFRDIIPDEPLMVAAQTALQLVQMDEIPALTIKIIADQEIQALNAAYRGIDKVTDVLSFEADYYDPDLECHYLGDVVICAPVVQREAQQQHKPEKHHWAHMVVHGVLHLRGYDHQLDEQAEKMETLEKQILAGLGIQDPYQMDVAV